MIYLLIQLSIWLILALILGVAIGWWLWHRKLQLTLDQNDALTQDAHANKSQIQTALGEAKDVKLKLSDQKGELLALGKELELNDKAHQDVVKGLNGEIKQLKLSLKKANEAKQDALSQSAGHQSDAKASAAALVVAKKQEVEKQSQNDDLLKKLGEANGKLGQLKKSETNLRGQLGSKDKDLSTLRKKIEDLEALKIELGKAQTQHQELQGLFDNQSSALEKTQGELVKARDTSSGHAAELAVLGTTLVAFKASQKENQAKYDELLQQLGDAQGQLEQLKQTEGDLRKQLGVNMDTIAEQKSQLAGFEDLRVELSKAQTQHHELQGLYHEQHSTLEKTQGELVEARDISSGHAAELSVLGTTLVALQASQKESQGKYDELLQQLGDAQGQLEQLKQTEGDLRKQIDAKGVIIHEQKEQLDALEGLRAELSKAQAQYQEVQSIYDNQSSMLEQVQGELVEARDTSSGRAAELAVLGTTLVALKSQHGEQKSQNDDLLKQLGEANGKLGQLKKSETNLRGQLESKDKDLSALRKKIEDLEALKIELGKAQTQHQELQGLFDNQSSALEKTQSELVKARDTSSGHAAELAVLGTTLVAFKASQKENQAKYDELLQQLGDAQGQLEQLKQTEGDLRKQLGVNIDTIAEQKSQLAGFEDLRVELSKAQTQHHELQGLYHEQHSTLELTQVELLESRETSSGRAAELAVLGTTLSTLRQDHEKANALVISLNEDNATLRESLGGIRMEKDQLQTSVKDLTSKLAWSESSLQALEGVRVSFAELKQEHGQCEHWKDLAVSLEKQLDETHLTIKAQDARYSNLFTQQDQTQKNLSTLTVKHQTNHLALNQYMEDLSKAHAASYDHAKSFETSQNTYHHHTKEQVEQILALLDREPAGDVPAWFVEYTQNNAYQAQFEALSEEHARLKQNYQSVQDKLNNASMLSEASQAEHKQWLDMANDDLMASTAALQALQAEADALQAELENAKTQCKECEESRLVLQQQLTLPVEPTHEPAPAPEPEPAVWAPPEVADETTEADELQRIKGIGPVLEGTLHDLGYRTFEQLASWSMRDIEYVTKQLDCFPDRIVRDEWVRQAGEFVAES